jgi:hypothetical protein
MPTRKPNNPIPELSQADISRLWSWVGVRGPDECWPWLGCPGAGQYGIISIRNRRYVSTRVIYRLRYGTDPADKLVCHTCDNPQCCNPAHFFLGTDQENFVDRDRKGRQPNRHGERNGRAVLTAGDVREIRQRFAAGETQTALGKEFGVTQMAVSKAIDRTNWRSIP